MTKIEIKNMDKHYKYGIVEGSNITLFNNSKVGGVTIISSDLLEDVNVEISHETGILYITARKIEFDLYFSSRTFKDEWDRTPDPKEIKMGRKWPWSKKEEFVYGGWVRTIERTPINYILSKYKVKILD